MQYLVLYYYYKIISSTMYYLLLIDSRCYYYIKREKEYHDLINTREEEFLIRSIKKWVFFRCFVLFLTFFIYFSFIIYNCWPSWSMSTNDCIQIFSPYFSMCVVCYGLNLKQYVSYNNERWMIDYFIHTAYNFHCKIKYA